MDLIFATGNKNKLLEINKIIPKNMIKIKYDLSKPNGTPRKVLDIKLANKFGWKSKTKLNEAIKKTYKDFLENNKIAQ